MDAQIASLVGVLVGALIGGGGALGAARIAGHDQRRNQHDHWRRQQQRSSYGQLLVQASETIRTGSKALDAYQDGDATAAEQADQFDEAARSLDAALVVVSLEGPETAASAALDLVGAIVDWANSLTLVIAIETGEYVPAGRAPRIGIAELASEKEKAYEASDAFTRLCRNLLDK